MINNILHWAADNGLSHIFYIGFMVAGFIAEFTYVAITSKKYKIPALKALLALIVIIIPTFPIMYLMCWIESGFTTWGGYNIVRIFVLDFIFIWPVAKLLKVDGWTLSDLLAPCLCIVQGVAHFGCMFDGCCHGYRVENGIWNKGLGFNTFPIQPIEAVVSLAIAVTICILQKKKNYQTTKFLYPLMLILFGSTRFIMEFARDNEKVFLGLSTLAIHAFIMFVVGLAVFLSLKSNENAHKNTNKYKKHRA